jgi:hypothetical protein
MSKKDEYFDMILCQDHCLFLLDEPDTHLNPIWKLRYFEEIEKVLQRNAGQTIKGDSQILITTHDPIMVGSLKKEQVKILRKERGKTSIEEPDQDPQGMGVTGSLKSELFGLSSTLDFETQRRLNEHAPLTEARRKIWQEMSKYIEEYYEYKMKCTGANHAVMKQKLSDVCKKIKKMTTKDDEILSSVARWCILFRNDQQLINLL